MTAAMPGPKFEFAIRCLAGAALVIGLGLLAVRSFVPGGTLVATTDFAKPAPYVSAAKPSERLDLIATGGRPVLGSPVYLDLKPPSRFDDITLELRYVNSSGAFLELGALASTLDEQYDLRPAENRLLDALNWKRVTSGRLTLYERDGRYASVDEFLADPPPRSRLATYRAAAPGAYRLVDYRPGSEPRQYDVSLRGRHRLLAYVENEPLSFAFVVQDMNRQAGADPVVVSVYREGTTEPLARTVLEDDGNALADQKSSGLRTVAISLTDPAAGLYQVEFTASADVFIRRTITPQRRWVFIDRLYLGDHVGYSDEVPPVTLTVSGQRLTARTSHQEGGQRLTVAGVALEVAEPLVKYSRPLGFGPQAMTSPKRDVLLETDGVFALSPDCWFEPLPLAIGWYTRPEFLAERGIDYVLTSFEPPAESDDGVKTAMAVFSESKLARTADGAFRFAVIVPGLTESQHDVRLIAADFVMSRRPEGWRGAWNRLTRLFVGRGEVAPLIITDGASYDESPE